MRRWGIPAALLCLPALYAIYLAAALALVLAADSAGLLTKEEASSAFVNPAFLSWRLQHHIMGTNFYAYVYFLFASYLLRGLFYARFAKAALMALLPCFLFLFLRKQFALRASHAFAGALAISFLPGFLSFSWLGVDFGIETPLGFAALWLALLDSPVAIVASSVLAALSAESYGAGVAFLVAVAASHLSRLRNSSEARAVFSGLTAMSAVLLVPVFWWTNIQTLLTGGAGDPQSSGALRRLATLPQELFIRGDSYYYFSDGFPALGSAFIGVLAIMGLALTLLRPNRPANLFIVSLAVLAIFAVAGGVTGVRRTMPLVICLGIFAALFLAALAQSPRLIARAAAYTCFALWIGIAAHAFLALQSGLASQRITLPHDFAFREIPGQTMQATIAQFLDRSRPLPADLTANTAGYEPDRTLSILYLLDRSHPLRSPQEIIRACDRHGWSIPSTAPRLLRLRRHFPALARE